MWLQNLLLLGTVVCSISAPTRPPSPVTRPFLHVEAIKEALSFLGRSTDPAAVLVSEGGRERGSCLGHLAASPPGLDEPCLSAS